MGEPSNPHPRGGLGRSESDPIRIRPRPLHLKAEQRKQIVSDDDRDMRFAGFILGQLIGLIGIRILSCGRDQTSSSEAKPHIIEKEHGARPQQPYCCDSSRQIDIDRMATIEIDDIESLSIPRQPDQVEQVCSRCISQKGDVSVGDAGRRKIGPTFGADMFEVEAYIVDVELVDGPEPLLPERRSYADLEKAAPRMLSKQLD